PWARALAAQANLMAGRLLGEACYFEAAERHALSCLEVGAPKTFPFRLAAAAQNGRGDPAAALAHLDRCLALGLDHFSVRLMRAEALRALGRAADAQRELMLAQQMAPTEPSVLAALRAAAPR
ncbi:MAG: hypothetical protein KDE27_11645, partial [Planctomycetes bacterium]|nr:hypothetical protein [Planctomycetota bacterium]